LEQPVGALVWLLLALVTAFVHRHAPDPGLDRWRWLPLAPFMLFLLLLPRLPRNLANLQLDRARLVPMRYQPPPATALAPRDYRRRGLLHALRGQEAAARQTWALDPDAALFLQEQGLWTHLREGDPAAALLWFERALAADSSVATIYYWQGKAYEALSRKDEAMVSYRQAVLQGRGETLFGRNLPALAWERRGRILVERGEWHAAAMAFGVATTLDPEVPDYRKQFEEVRHTISVFEEHER
jgi:tetratricopeptide (TPR) repeat protein